MAKPPLIVGLASVASRPFGKDSNARRGLSPPGVGWLNPMRHPIFID